MKSRNTLRSSKLAAVIGIGATTAFLNPTTNADVIDVDDSPIFSGLVSASIDWDIDGDGQSEFRLTGTTSITSNSGYFFIGRRLFFTSLSGGSGLVESPEGVQALSSGQIIGPTLATNYSWQVRSRTAMFSSVRGYGGYASSVSNGYRDFDVSNGLNMIGFRFTSGGNTHYGYAEMNFDLPSERLTITRWHYESTPDTSIQVGGIPEPSGLGLLAAGAAGLAVLRKRRSTRPKS